MKHFIIDEHSDTCKKRAFIDLEDIFSGFNQHKYCDQTPERLLFFAGNNFFLISYFRCLKPNFDEYEFIKSLIETAIGKLKILELYRVRKSVNVERDLNNFKTTNRHLRENIEQVNFIYGNASTKFAITTYTPYIDAICDNEIIRSNYKIAKEYLYNNKLGYLINELDNLFQANYFLINDEEVILKTTDQLLQNIKSLIN